MFQVVDTSVFTKLVIGKTSILIIVQKKFAPLGFSRPAEGCTFHLIS